jgi:ribosomal protein S25
LPTPHPLYAGFSRTRAKDVTVTDFLDEKRREITDRLKELKPLVKEFNRLEAAAIALAGALGSAASDAGQAVVRRRGPGRPRRAAASATKAAKAAKAPKAVKAKAARKPAGRPAKRRAGRRKGSGTRAAEALSFVQAQPGITIPELAVKMGIKQNYLYRVLPGLEKEGKLEKKGRGWHPKAA